MIANYISKWCARAGQFLRQIIDLAVELIADDEPLFGVEHGEAARHVVEGNLEPLIDACELFLV